MSIPKYPDYLKIIFSSLGPILAAFDHYSYCMGYYNTFSLIDKGRQWLGIDTMDEMQN